MDDSLLRAQARRRCQQETRQPGKGRGSARARDARLRGSRAAAGGGVRCAGKLGRRRRRLQAGGCGCDGSIGDVPCDGRASRLGRGAAAGLSRAAQPLHRRGQVRAGRDGRQGRQDGSRCDAAPPCRPRRAVARRPIRRTKRPRIGPWPRCPIRTASRPQQPEIPRLWHAPHDSLPLASTCRLPCTRQRRMRPVGRASGGAIGFGGGGSLRDDADAHRAAAPAGGLSGPRVYRGLASFQKGSHVSGWLAAVAWGATALDRACPAHAHATPAFCSPGGGRCKRQGVGPGHRRASAGRQGHVRLSAAGRPAGNCARCACRPVARRRQMQAGSEGSRQGARWHVTRLTLRTCWRAMRDCRGLAGSARASSEQRTPHLTRSLYTQAWHWPHHQACTASLSYRRRTPILCQDDEQQHLMPARPPSRMRQKIDRDASFTLV